MLDSHNYMMLEKLISKNFEGRTESLHNDLNAVEEEEDNASTNYI